MLNAEVPGNIGELKSIIQFCCVNAFFEADSLVRINLHHVPYKLISQRSITEAHHQNVLDFYTVEQLIQLYDKDQKAILFSNQLLELFQERNAASQDVSASLILQMRVLLMKHLDERIEESSESEHSYCLSLIHI